MHVYLGLFVYLISFQWNWCECECKKPRKLQVFLPHPPTGPLLREPELKLPRLSRRGDHGVSSSLPAVT